MGLSRDDIMVVNKLQISLELRRSDTICSFIFIGQHYLIMIIFFRFLFS